MCEIMEEYGKQKEAEGMAKGMAKGILKMAVSMWKKGKLTEQEAAEEAGMTTAEFRIAITHLN